MKANEEGFTSNVKNKYIDEEKGIRVHANLVKYEEQFLAHSKLSSLLLHERQISKGRERPQ